MTNLPAASDVRRNARGSACGLLRRSARRRGMIGRAAHPGPGSRQDLCCIIGFSADALTPSNPRRVGQGSIGARSPLGRWDGSKVRVAAMRSLPGLHKMVWGLGGRNALKSMGAGRAKSPARDEPAKRFGGLTGARCPEEGHGWGDATGARSGPPCQGCVVLQHTSCVPCCGTSAGK